MSANQDSSLVTVVEAVDQRSNGGLATTGWSDQCHCLTSRNLQVDIVQNRIVGIVAEVDLFKAYGSIGAPNLLGVWLILDADWHIQHFKNPLSRGHCSQEGVVVQGESANWIKETLHIKDVGDHHPSGQFSLKHEVPSDQSNDTQGQSGQRVDRGQHQLGDGSSSDGRAEVIVGLGFIEVAIDSLSGHSLNHADSSNVFTHRRSDD